MTKPGFTTTEFWTTLIAQLAALVTLLHPSSVVLVPNAGIVQAFSVLAAAVAAGLYSHSRARVKVAVGSATVAVPGPVGDSHIEPLVQR